MIVTFSGVSAVDDHPSVKTVTPHRSMQRTIKYVLDDDDDDASGGCDGADCIYSGWRKHKFRRTQVNIYYNL